MSLWFGMAHTWSWTQRCLLGVIIHSLKSVRAVQTQTKGKWGLQKRASTPNTRRSGNSQQYPLQSVVNGDSISPSVKTAAVLIVNAYTEWWREGKGKRVHQFVPALMSCGGSEHCILWDHEVCTLLSLRITKMWKSFHGLENVEVVKDVVWIAETTQAQGQQLVK